MHFSIGERDELCVAEASGQRRIGLWLWSTQFDAL